VTAHLSAETRAVVRAFDGLTTQVRRIADALTTPVVGYEVTADDAPTTGVRPDFTSPLAGRIEVRQPCPYCGDRQMIPTHQFDEHIARLHPDVRTGGPGIPVPAADEDAQRTTRHAQLHNVLARLDRDGLLVIGERMLLREHVEAEIREADTMRSVAAGNKRHVQVMYAELEQAQAAIERVREFAEYTRDKTSAGRNDHEIGQYETAVQVLALLVARDGAEQPEESS
jgi:hypothetical protein